MPKKKKTFLMIGDDPSPVTRTAFRRMPKDRKRELMLEWFRANYEDPAERTPYESAEGGYQWIWGGPYDAEEEIRENFEGLAPESLITEVVGEVQSEGLYEWAPTPRRSDYEEDEPSEPQPDILGDIANEVGPRFGSAEERVARGQVIDALRELERVSRKSTAPGIGHNRPPLDVFDFDVPENGAEVELTARELREELEKPQPEISVTKRLLHGLGNALGASARYVFSKVDKVVDSAATTTGKAIVVAFAARDPAVRSAASAVWHTFIQWIHLATSLH